MCYFHNRLFTTKQTTIILLILVVGISIALKVISIEVTYIFGVIAIFHWLHIRRVKRIHIGIGNRSLVIRMGSITTTITVLIYTLNWGTIIISSSIIWTIIFVLAVKWIISLTTYRQRVFLDWIKVIISRTMSFRPNIEIYIYKSNKF